MVLFRVEGGGEEGKGRPLRWKLHLNLWYKSDSAVRCWFKMSHDWSVILLEFSVFTTPKCILLKWVAVKYRLKVKDDFLKKNTEVSSGFTLM